MAQPPTLHRSLSKTFILTSAIPLLLLSVVILYHLIISYTREIKLKNQVLARAVSGQVEAQLLVRSIEQVLSCRVLFDDCPAHTDVLGTLAGK